MLGTESLIKPNVSCGGADAAMQYNKFVDLVLDCANLWTGDGGDRSFKTQPPSVSTLLELLSVVLHKVSAPPIRCGVGRDRCRSAQGRFERIIPHSQSHL